VLAAFKRHQLVAVGETHGQQEHGDAQQTLLADPRLPQVVDDIVVEFGNSLYQPLMDRFVAGPAVNNLELRLVWRNTTVSPLDTGDEPIREQFYRTVRAVNWTLPPEQQIRVLLGDPPINWSRIRTNKQVIDFLNKRDTYPASLLEREVLAKGRRALIFYGSEHVPHSPAPGQNEGPPSPEHRAEDRPARLCDHGRQPPPPGVVSTAHGNPVRGHLAGIRGRRGSSPTRRRCAASLWGN